MSEHSANMTSLLFGFLTWLWRYTCLLLLISMFWHKQVIFEFKGGNLSFSAECRSFFDPGSLKTHIRQQTECPLTNRWAVKDQAKNLNLTARPYDEWTFNSLDFTAVWLSHLALAMYMFFLLISMLWHRQAIFVSKGDKLSSSAEWGFEPGSLKTPFRPQTECSLTNPLSYRESSSKLDFNSQSLWWAFSSLYFNDVWLSHMALAIYMFVDINFDALAEASDIRI